MRAASGAADQLRTFELESADTEENDEPVVPNLSSSQAGLRFCKKISELLVLGLLTDSCGLQKDLG